MKKKSKMFDNKTILWMLATAAALVIVISVILGFSATETLNDEYFVTDDSKYVMQTDIELTELWGSEYEPEAIYNVYYLKGDNVTSVKYFYEYSDSNAAAAAIDNLEMADWMTSKTQSGKYIIFQLTSSSYEDTTKADLERLAE